MENMNGYKLTADAYRALKKKDPEADVDSNIKVLDFLATCNDEDICNLFNSSAFNSICRGYVELALKDFTELDDDLKSDISQRVASMFDLKTAKEAKDFFKR